MKITYIKTHKGGEPCEITKKRSKVSFGRLLENGNVG